MFPEQNYTGTYVSSCIQDYGSVEINHISSSPNLMKNPESERGDDHQNSVPIESNISSTSDLSASQRRLRKKTATSIIDSVNLLSEPNPPSLPSSVATFAKHTKNECLACCRVKALNKSLDTIALNIRESKDLVLNGKNRDPDVSFYSPESIRSDDSGNTNMPDRISNTILRNVMKMANPIMYKACRKILMELKQKFPQSFQDICLYSEVCKHMSQCSYRMNVRRFIQEIFLDLNYEELALGVENILEAAQQRFTDMKHLNSSKLLPLSSSPTQSPVNFPHPQTTVSIPSLKIHSLKSPLLASVYETSVENLMDSPPRITKDEVDAVMLRSPDKNKGTSPGGSTQVTAEVHAYRHSMESRAELCEPLRRRRFNTLELDLSCTRNKFPIKHRSPTTDEPLASSTLRRPISLNTYRESHQKPLYKSNISTSEHSFEAASRETFSSPVSPPLGTLFCEQRLSTSRSEATLNKKSNFKKADERTNDE